MPARNVVVVRETVTETTGSVKTGNRPEVKKMPIRQKQRRQPLPGRAQEHSSLFRKRFRSLLPKRKPSSKPKRLNAQVEKRKPAAVAVAEDATATVAIRMQKRWNRRMKQHRLKPLLNRQPHLPTHPPQKKRLLMLLKVQSLKRPRPVMKLLHAAKAADPTQDAATQVVKKLKQQLKSKLK